MIVAVEQAQKSLEDEVYPMKTFAQVEKVLSDFAIGAKHHRRPALAIIGGTNVGKSMLGANVLRRVGKLLGIPSFLEVTVESNEHLDVVDFIGETALQWI